MATLPRTARSARFGDLGALSFHETKNVTAARAARCCVNDAELVERAEIVREKGTEPQPVLPRRRSTSTPGSTSAPRSALSEINAAFLWAQLEAAERDHAAPPRGSGTATTPRSPTSRPTGSLRRPIVPADCAHNAHMYYLLLPDLDDARPLIDELACASITASSTTSRCTRPPRASAIGRASGDLVHDGRGERAPGAAAALGRNEGTEIERVVEAVEHGLRASRLQAAVRGN